MGEARITRSSGNVFEDLGLPDAEESLAKADLARQIGRLIGQHGWTQKQAAQALGIDQPKVSALMRGRLEGFSTERLIRFLNNPIKKSKFQYVRSLQRPSMPDCASISCMI